MTIRSIFAAAMLISAPALAQEEPKVDCNNAQTQVELNFCAHADWEEADVELNFTYKEVRAKLEERDKEWTLGGPTSVERLLDAQRSWITYRDAHCEVDSYYARGGSMQPMLYSGCLATLTRNRTKELKSLIAEY